MLSRFVLSLGTNSLDVLSVHGNVLFYALYLRFVWVLISFWAKPFDDWSKILHIEMGLSCSLLSRDCVMYGHMQAVFPSDASQINEVPSKA